MSNRNIERLATALHDINCRQDHTEGCDWFYGKWPAERKDSARQRYLSYAADLATKRNSVKEPLNVLVDTMIVLRGDYKRE